MVSNFPFLSRDEFKDSCVSLVEAFNRSDNLQNEWDSMNLVHSSQHMYLRITKTLSLPEALRDEEQRHSVMETDMDCEDVKESDEEAFARDINPGKVPYVEYHILLSPVYRVPVLYFFLRDMPRARISSTEMVTKLVVSPEFRPAVQSSGIIGGVSMSDHPVFGLPVFFVHPCNTAAAMAEIALHDHLSPADYIRLWFGIAGACVGLSIPAALVAV